MDGRLGATVKGRKSLSERRWLPVGMRILSELPKLLLRSRQHGMMSGDLLSVWLDGRRRSVRAEVVDEEAEMTTLFETIRPGNPALGCFQGIRIEPDGRPNEGDMGRAIERGVAVIRLHPERDDEEIA